MGARSQSEQDPDRAGRGLTAGLAAQLPGRCRRSSAVFFKMRLKESIGERPLEFPSNSLICWVKTLDRFVTDTSKSDGLGWPEARRSPPPEAGAQQPQAGMGYSCELAVFFLPPPHLPNLVPGSQGAVWRV